MSGTSTPIRRPQRPIKCGVCSVFGSDPVYHDTFEEVRQCSLRGKGDAQLLPTPVDWVVRVRRPLHEGKYTVVFGDGERRTLRIRRQDEHDGFKPGQLLVGYLIGPDNDHAYKNFAHVDPQGNVRIWLDYRESQPLIEAVKVLVGDPAAAAQAFGIESGVCGICGRTLTTPESIALGIGPVCARRVGAL